MLQWNDQYWWAQTMTDQFREAWSSGFGSPTEGLDKFEGVSFAYVSPLELLYPTVAYCDLGVVYFWDSLSGIFWLIFTHFY